MSAYSGRMTNTLAAFVLAVGCSYWAGIEAAAAQQTRSTNQIIDALKPAPRTRSLTATPADTASKAEDARFVDTLRNRPTRSLTTEERTKIATITKEKPSIDLEINFEYNSDRISSAAALHQVTALGQALSSPELRGAPLSLRVIPMRRAAIPSIRAYRSGGPTPSGGSSKRNSISMMESW